MNNPLFIQYSPISSYFLSRHNTHHYIMLIYSYERHFIFKSTEEQGKTTKIGTGWGDENTSPFKREKEKRSDEKKEGFITDRQLQERGIEVHISRCVHIYAQLSRHRNGHQIRAKSWIGSRVRYERSRFPWLPLNRADAHVLAFIDLIDVTFGNRRRHVRAKHKRQYHHRHLQPNQDLFSLN